MGIPQALPTIRIGGEEYFVDVRLKELRNVNNPHDRRLLKEVPVEIMDELEN